MVKGLKFIDPLVFLKIYIIEIWGEKIVKNLMLK
jgi:hypothetical protein